MKEKAPGKTLLKVVGIIMVVLGVLSFLFNLINFAAIGMIGEGELGEILEQTLAAQGVTMEEYQISVYVTAAGALLNTVAGILAIVNCNKIRKAGVCFICGILLILWQLGNDAYAAVTSGVTVLSVINMAVGLVLPLLYFWGALKIVRLCWTAWIINNRGGRFVPAENEDRTRQKGRFCFALFSLVSRGLRLEN